MSARETLWAGFLRTTKAIAMTVSGPMIRETKKRPRVCNMIETDYDDAHGLKVLRLVLSTGRRIRIKMTGSELNTLVFHLQAMQGGEYQKRPTQL